MPGDPSSALAIDIYQIPEDPIFRGHRIDGTGWHWSWADWQRDWMNDTPNKYAYRCLPLTIANQIGWWVYNPVGFNAIWTGHPNPGGVQFIFDSDPKLWCIWINDQFGHGIVTWNTPFLIRTKPVGSRLLITGPTNQFKDAIQPLTAVIESDWMSMSFTMNWKITRPGMTIRFDVGEPLFQIIPLMGNVGRDLENATVTYQKLSTNPQIEREFTEWREGRTKFHQQKAAGEVSPDGWQKDYFRGHTPAEGGVVAGHMTKVIPPTIQFRDPQP